jgi:hypothetical protein
MLKAIVQSLGLTSPTTARKSRELENAQAFEAAYGTKRPSAFEIAHFVTACALLACGGIAPPPTWLQVVEGLIRSIVALLSKLHRDTEQFAALHPLHDAAQARVSAEQFSGARKVLEKDKARVLLPLFAAYAEPRAAPRSYAYYFDPVSFAFSAAERERPVARAGVDEESERERERRERERVGKDAVPLSNLLQFCRDFQLCPDLLSKAQVHLHVQNKSNHLITNQIFL